MDFTGLSPADISHAILIAVVMHSGGSLTLPASALEADALGGPDGGWHALCMEPQTDGGVRIAVQPRPDVPGAGKTIY
ncbi:pRL2-19 [Streptomyces violaceusniger]|uniref:pRL2-19 n=1 Tax=Streptomyces violaceusniger TaxID=68280 RepID=UPI00380F73E2